MRPSLQSVRSQTEITSGGESAQDLATVFHFQSKLFEPELGKVFRASSKISSSSISMCRVTSSMSWFSLVSNALSDGFIKLSS